MTAASTDHADTVRDSLSWNVAIDVASRFGYLFTRFLVPPFILAHITLEAYGLWATAFIVVSYLGVSTMGISNVYIKYVAEFAARKDFQRANQLLSTGLFVTVPICLSAFAAMLLFWSTMADWLHVSQRLRVDAHEVILSVVAIFLTSMSLSAFRDALVATQQTFRVQLIWVFSYTTETMLIFVLVAANRGIRGLAEAFVVRTALEIGCSSFAAFRSLSWLKISFSLFSRDSLRLLFAFGGITQLQSFLAVILNSAERLIAAPLVGLEATGLLEIAKKMPAMASSIPLAFAASLLPAASYLHGGDSTETVQKLYLKGGRYMHLASALMLALIATAPLPILTVWFGKCFRDTAYLVTVFCIAGQFNLLTGAGTSIFRGIGRIHEEFFYSIPNLLLIGILVPISHVVQGHWSAKGVGTAVAVSTCLAAFTFLIRTNKQLKVPFAAYWKIVVIPGLVPYLVALPLAVPIFFIVNHASRLTAAVGIAAAGLVYAGLSLLLITRFVFEPGERLWFKAMISATMTHVLARMGGRYVRTRLNRNGGSSALTL